MGRKSPGFISSSFGSPINSSGARAYPIPAGGHSSLVHVFLARHAKSGIRGHGPAFARQTDLAHARLVHLGGTRPKPQLDCDLMDTVEQALKAAVERRHGGTACLAYIDAVSARVPGRPVWNGIVLAGERAPGRSMSSCTVRPFGPHTMR